jgi:2-dehydro-3-deoxygluconokinase
MMHDDGGPRVVGIGEALLRLAAPPATRLERARSFTVHVGGAELNALVLLRHLGFTARWVSRLPDNQLGRLVHAYVLGEGIEPQVTWSDDRQALYFLEEGTPPRPPEVLYDRAGSAAARLGSDHVAVADVLADADVVHSTGITLGIGAEPRKFVTDAFRYAQSTGAVTSFDVNYRSKLWEFEEARSAVVELLDQVDVLFASRFDLVDLLRLGEDPIEAARDVRDRHGCQIVVMPERKRYRDGTEEIGVHVVGDEELFSGFVTVRATESIGVGDAISAGFLSGWFAGDVHLAARRAAGAGAMKATVAGDALIAAAEELDREVDQGQRVIR